MALCLNIFVAYAQKENPRGTYKMTKLTGKGGVEIDAPFDQYKICEEGMTISVFVQPLQVTASMTLQTSACLSSPAVIMR